MLVINHFLWINWIKQTDRTMALGEFKQQKFTIKTMRVQLECQLKFLSDSTTKNPAGVSLRKVKVKTTRLPLVCFSTMMIFCNPISTVRLESCWWYPKWNDSEITSIKWTLSLEDSETSKASMTNYKKVNGNAPRDITDNSKQYIWYINIADFYFSKINWKFYFQRKPSVNF